MRKWSWSGSLGRQLRRKVMPSEGHEEFQQGRQAPDQWVPAAYRQELGSMAGRRALSLVRPRLLRAALRLLTYALLAAAFGFLGGWLGPEVLDDDSTSPSSPEEELAASLFPAAGVTLDFRWGDIPRRLVAEGVIDLGKFSAAAQAAGSPLTPEQVKLLNEGSDDSLRFDKDTANFFLEV